MKKFALLIALSMTAIGLNSARADPYPSRVVKIIVPIAAGGPIDSIARSIAQTLSDRLKQTFVVENRPGAGGNIGIQAAIGAEPDGYTLLLAAGSMLTVNPLIYKKAPFDPGADLRPLTTLTVSTQTLVVHPSLTVKTLSDFIAYAKKEPLTYATSGYGSPSHLAMEYLRMLAGFSATPVSYRGLSPLMIDLLSGQVKVGFVSTSGAIGNLREGKLRGIAISGAQRSRLLKEIPTIAESGFPQYELDSYILMLAPAHLPEPIAALL
ncbi:MAG: tripartite tricarboxylate transporter substrate binding protein, partial [Proteobacteria bacterium]|nr:tripartite tricarboxylate transporter substrate binding protein [Pseudomonadota bacterium]